MIQNGEFHIGFRVLVKTVRLMAGKTVTNSDHEYYVVC